jgi:hypothetical protein
LLLRFANGKRSPPQPAAARQDAAPIDDLPTNCAQFRKLFEEPRGKVNGLQRKAVSLRYVN